MSASASAMEPSFLSLRGRVDHHVLEDAIDSIQRGDYPGWRIVRETNSAERAGAPGWRVLVASLASLVFGMFNQPSTAPTRTFVVEHVPTRRRVRVAFEYLGEANGLPLWQRA